MPISVTYDEVAGVERFELLNQNLSDKLRVERDSKAWAFFMKNPTNGAFSLNALKKPIGFHVKQKEVRNGYR